MKEPAEQIISDVEEVYGWIAAQIAGLDGKCKACGQCCDFAQYGHRLYVTTPEILYFLGRIDKELRIMESETCPYREKDGRCGAYEQRFAACRIFLCRAEPEKQHELCETAIGKMRQICVKNDLPYHYMELKYALNKPELWMA